MDSPIEEHILQVAIYVNADLTIKNTVLRDFHPRVLNPTTGASHAIFGDGVRILLGSDDPNSIKHNKNLISRLRLASFRSAKAIVGYSSALIRSCVDISFLK